MVGRCDATTSCCWSFAATLAATAIASSSRTRLRGRLAQGEVAERRMAATPSRLREQLATRFADWTGVLQQHPAQARQILKKLLVGPLRFTPRRGFYEFEGEVSFDKLLTDAGFPILVASPPGYPTLYLEGPLAA